MLRGLGRETKHWDEDFLNMLVRRDLVPELIDLPGAGDFRDILSPTDIADYVSFLQSQWKKLNNNPDEKVYLLGHSLGGMIAIRWAFEYPEQFHKVLLVNTSDQRSNSLTRRLKPFGLMKLMKIMASPEIKTKEQEVLEMISNNDVAKKQVLDRWVNIACTRPMKTLSLINQVYAASKFSAPTKLQVPAVYITSTADKMVSHKCSETLARLHKATLHKHDKAGHDLPLDDPDWLADCIARSC
jgi:alpha-beta hydrolase superfamily lysophospholipase